MTTTERELHQQRELLEALTQRIHPRPTRFKSAQILHNARVNVGTTPTRRGRDTTWAWALAVSFDHANICIRPEVAVEAAATGCEFVLLLTVMSSPEQRDLVGALTVLHPDGRYFVPPEMMFTVDTQDKHFWEDTAWAIAWLGVELRG